MRLWVTPNTGVDQQMPSPFTWPAARGVDDRVLDVLGDLVADDEDQVCLGQEPRLEDAPAVLVCDPLFAAVPDGLDHGDADMTGLLLDRLHHGLDAVAYDDRFDFGHGSRLLGRMSPFICRLLDLDQQKKPQDSTES